MSTQATIAITRKGAVIIKVVVGCNGYNAPELVKLFKKEKLDDPKRVLFLSRMWEFGCDDCRVVQTGPDTHLPKEVEIPEAVAALYRDKFSDPLFNPRWEHGTASFSEVVTLD